MKQLRNATFRDAQAIDGIVAAFSPLDRDLHSWVNQADFHVALVDGDDVIGFGARMKHSAHPRRDLAAVYVDPTAASDHECTDALYQAVAAKKPLKVRVRADDDAGLAVAARRGFTERIRSATYRVPASAFARQAPAYEVREVYDATKQMTDAITVLYADSHQWDPPAVYTRRYVRQTMLHGAQQMALVYDNDGDVIGAGAALRSDDASVAADIALVGPLDQAHPDADAITQALLVHLASFYADARAPLWFEIDTGAGTNLSLARAITALAPAEEEVVILTSD